MGPTWVLSAPDGPMWAPWTLLAGELWLPYRLPAIHRACMLQKHEPPAKKMVNNTNFTADWTLLVVSILIAFSWEKHFWFLTFHKCPNDNESELVQVMAWRRTVEELHTHQLLTVREIDFDVISSYSIQSERQQGSDESPTVITVTS